VVAVSFIPLLLCGIGCAGCTSNFVSSEQNKARWICLASVLPVSKTNDPVF
jgi:hypothetical protein